MLIAVDFDGTIVEHKYPEIGKEIPFAFEVLRAFMADGHKLVLWTVREGKLLDDALEFCHQNGVEFYAINSDTPDDALFKDGMKSTKLRADVYIDDRNVGGLPPWDEIYTLVTNKQLSRRHRHHHRSLFAKLFK